jgi:hypothetical protein
MARSWFESDTDGNLYDTNLPNWTARPIRTNYKRHYTTIKTVSELRATLRAGSHTSLGCYPLFFYTSDGGALSFKTVRAEFENVCSSIRAGINDGWRVIGCDVNWESELYDDDTSEPIESAYGIAD